MSTTISPWGIGGGGTWTYITGGTVSLTTSSTIIYSATKQCYVNMWSEGTKSYTINIKFNGNVSTSNWDIQLNGASVIDINGQGGLSRTVSRGPCTVLLNSGDSIKAALIQAGGITLYYQAFTI